MNDFTKEELIYILKCACPRNGIHFESACKKLNEMIDNYCEHDESQSDHNYEIERCKKCGKLFV